MQREFLEMLRSMIQINKLWISFICNTNKLIYIKLHYACRYTCRYCRYYGIPGTIVTMMYPVPFNLLPLQFLFLSHKPRLIFRLTALSTLIGKKMPVSGITFELSIFFTFIEREREMSKEGQCIILLRESYII